MRDVFDRKLIVRIVANLAADIDHNQRRNQSLRRDLIDGPTAPGEMRRSINMRAEVFRQGDIAGVVVILLDGRDRFYLVGRFLRKLVSWDLLVDAMRQVDDATKPGGLHRIGVPLPKQQQSYGQCTTNNKRKKLHYSSADPCSNNPVTCN